MDLDDRSKCEFFSCYVFDSYKDDTASMEHPIFSLSTKPDFRVLVYEHNGNTIRIKPSYTGLATIFDKDILLYLASSLMNAKNCGKKISQRVQFTAYDYIVSTNRALDGRSYQQIKDGLSRLKGTVIETNIKTNNITVDSEFSLIDEWRIIKEDKNGRMIGIEVKLSDWFYNSIIGNAVLTIDKNYFDIRKPTERRLYELARKHCGDQVTWRIRLETLKIKLGITSPIKTLRFNIKKITDQNCIPEYNIYMQDDLVIFTHKNNKEKIKFTSLPYHITKSDISKVALPGETEQDVINRIYIISNKSNKNLKTVVSELIIKNEQRVANKNTTKNEVSQSSSSSKASNLEKIQELKAAINGTKK